MKVQFSTDQKEFLSRPLTASISVTHSTEHYPIVFPAWILEIDDKLYISTGKNSKKVKHLKEGHAKIGVTVIEQKGYPYLSISGDVSFIKEESDEFKPIRKSIFSKYNREIDDSGEQIARILIVVTPRYVFGGVK